MCKYCDDNGVLPRKTYRTYRSYRWLRRRYPTRRWSEPKMKMETCPYCKVGGIR